MNLITKYIVNNPYYKDGKYISGSELYGFILHSVGVGQPNPLVFWNNWNKASFNYAGINGFIGDTDVIITAPCLETPGKVKRMPHGGKPYSNNHYIGFEMCEPSSIVYTGNGANFTIKDRAAAQAFVKKTYANAVQLFAKLCKLHGKDPLKSGVILSHNEAGKKGIASGHVDPEHLWNGLGLSYTMDGFRKDVKAAMSGVTIQEDTPTATNQLYRVRKEWKDAKTQIGAFTNLNSAKELAKANPGYNVFDKFGTLVYTPQEQQKGSYRVRITANVLNVRAGAGTSYKVNMTVKKGGVYTIVEEKNGWGKLKSGAGWISLAYTERV